MLLKNGLLVAPNQVPETATPASAADTCHPGYSILIPIFVMVNILGSSNLEFLTGKVLARCVAHPEFHLLP